MTINEKHKLVADEYLITMNKSRSYMKYYKGVKDRSVASAAASRLFARDDVKKYLDERIKQINDEQIAKQDEVLRYLSSILRGEETEEVLIGTGPGVQNIATIDVSSKERIRAAELLGRRYGIFTDKVEMTADMGVKIVDDID